ncbi:MAG: hypothetical protein E6G56_03770 [Actinobacteria bacterium]|nr:MAG: hypothetical protein E6G56_03770 [Actinomycetota bacterium]
MKSLLSAPRPSPGPKTTPRASAVAPIASSSERVTPRGSAHCTYVGLRRSSGWELLAITALSTTTVVREQTGLGRDRDVAAQAARLAGAILEDLTGAVVPPAARASVAEQIAPQLEGDTFVCYSSDLRGLLPEPASD